MRYSVRSAAFDVEACCANLQALHEQQQAEREQRRQAALAAVCAAIRQVAPGYPAVEHVYLFGSVLRPGAMHAGSDIDIAIDKKLSAEDYFALWRDLERAAPDWQIDLRELEPDGCFAEGVRKRGMVVYERADANIESGDSG
jgi:predicted nucleotidyltransferase